MHFGLCRCLLEPSVSLLLAVPWNKGWDSTPWLPSPGFLSCPASQAACSALPAHSEPLPWNFHHQEPQRVGSDLGEGRAGGCAALPLPHCGWASGAVLADMRECPGCGDGMVGLESPSTSRGVLGSAPGQQLIPVPSGCPHRCRRGVTTTW